MNDSFCLDCDGNIPDAPRQDRPVTPASGSLRATPAIILAACFLLLLIITAILLQDILLHPAPAPVAVNASTLPLPSIPPEVHGAAEIATTPGSVGSSMVVSVINTTSLAKRVHDLVNRERQAHGLMALRTDAALASVARAHSEEMAAHGYFGHLNLQERDATARGAAAGYTCHRGTDTYYSYAIAENLFATYPYDSVLSVHGSAVGFGGKTEEAIAVETVDGWMKSPDHRENLLDPALTRQGIGVAAGKEGLVFMTQDLC